MMNLFNLHALDSAKDFIYGGLDPISLVRDHKIKEELTSRGIIVRSFNGDVLYEPWEITDEEGQPFTTFHEYWNKCLNMPYDPAAPILPPKRIIAGNISNCHSDYLGLEDESEKGSNALLARAWEPGCSSADKALTAFINGPLIDYAINRRKADSATTSLLSPHLHFGELSARKVFHLVRIKQVCWANEGNTSGERSVNYFLRAIGLREYSRYFSFNFPCSHEKPLLAHLIFFPWRMDKNYFKIWRQGRTGYPLVDAGMRELWATGWLHDCIRVVVSSFFVKVLQLPWRWGMKYFWDTLLDADLECDALGWQYITGCLPDGREIDRVDNPQFEGYRFDPAGEYVRRWLPELSRLPTEWIHHPWDAPQEVLQAAGIELGSNYPLPIVELSEAKQRLQEGLIEMWQREAAARDGLENGNAEGLGESLDTTNSIASEHMDLEREPPRNFRDSATRPLQDQLVPSMSHEFERLDGTYSLTQDISLPSSEQAAVPSITNIGRTPVMQARQLVRQPAQLVQTNLDDVVSSHRERDVAGEQSETNSTADSSNILRVHDHASVGGMSPVWRHRQPFQEERVHSH
eukprot:TRINITY_DN4238_c0_g2_i1.p1 TRINITY_DN4238_c0_g2~~TRINITY_DN4238_c0_g2_i1.p1  ORF type:complete len:576 (-),score=103.25 TRINITY_DN4238_c0_g2_i1:333-2060(-)